MCVGGLSVCVVGVLGVVLSVMCTSGCYSKSSVLYYL